MFNLWKPLLPPDGQLVWGPELVKDADGNMLHGAWYFNDHFPWLGMAICAPVVGLWYWCTDQYIVQRALGARDEKTARRGSIFAAFLKLFPVYLFIVPGLICFALAKTGKVPELALIAQNSDAGHAAAQRAFPMMVKYMLPTGLRGIVVAGLLSALMGSLAGVFNACSTLFTVDLYEKWKPSASAASDRAHRPHRHGRDGADRPGLAPRPGKCQQPVRLPAEHPGIPGPADLRRLLLRRILQAAQRQGLSVGDDHRISSLGLFRMAVDTPVTMKLPGFENGYAQDSFLWIVNNIFYQYFSILITVVSAAVMVVVSYMTSPPSETQIRSLTFGTATADDKQKTRASWDWREVAASAFVLAAIVGAYLYFRG